MEYLVALVHELEDAELVIAVNVRYEHGSRLQDNFVYFVFAAKVIEYLTIASFGTIHHYCGIFIEHID